MSNETTSGKYAYIFTTTDCIKRPVALKHGTFTDKIVLTHREITSETIKDGVESPHLITEDPQIKNRRRYYKYIQMPNNEVDYIANLKVVVEDKNSKYDEVVTAYILGDLKNESSKARVIYDSSSASKS